MAGSKGEASGKLEFDRPGIFHVTYAGVFVVEVFVSEAFVVNVTQPVVTYGGFLPLNLYRSSVFTTTGSYSKLANMPNKCLAEARGGKVGRTDAVRGANFTLICDTTDKGSRAAWRGNVTLRINMPCSKSRLGDRCDTCTLCLRDDTVALDAVEGGEGIWLFRVRDRKIQPVSELVACSAGYTVELPRPKNITEMEHYSAGAIMEVSKRKVTLDSDWCKKSDEARREAMKKVERQLTQMAERRFNKKELMTAFEQCFATCGRRRRGTIWKTKLAACREFLMGTPISMGGAQKANNNTYNIVTSKSKFRNHVCTDPKQLASGQLGVNGEQPGLRPGTGRRVCDQTVHTLTMMLFPLLNATFRPDPKIEAEEFLFQEAANPSPVPELLAQQFAMEATGEVTVWLTYNEFKLASSPMFPVLPLLVNNRNVTHVRIMVEEKNYGALSKFLPARFLEWLRADCEWYIERLERALAARRRTSCPRYSRAELAEYEIQVIDKHYNGWSQVKDRSTGKFINNPVKQVCAL